MKIGLFLYIYFGFEVCTTLSSTQLNILAKQKRLNISASSCTFANWTKRNYALLRPILNWQESLSHDKTGYYAWPHLLLCTYWRQSKKERLQFSVTAAAAGSSKDGTRQFNLVGKTDSGTQAKQTEINVNTDFTGLFSPAILPSLDKR